MTVELRRLFLAGFVGAALALTACGGGDDGPGPDAPGGTQESCVSDEDCPNPSLFYCDSNTLTCVPTCRTAEDCSASVRGEYALDYCAGGLGCACDIGSRGGTCVAARCSADSECGSNVCRNGACVAAPAASTVAKCQVTPDYVVTSVGSRVKFHVSAWTGTNEPVVVNSNITWTAQDATVSLAGAANGTSADYKVDTASASGAAASVRVSVGSASCEASVLALGPPATNEIRAVVTDELTGRPVSGATLLVTQGSAATLVGKDGSDARGVAVVTVAGAMPGTVTATVFHNSYGYMTVAGYPTSGSRSLAFPLRRNQIDNFGGFKGGMNNVPDTANVHAALAGMSIAGAITDVSYVQLLGNTVPTDVVIGSAVNRQDVPLPAGAFLKFNSSDIKTQISAQGLAGVCTSASGVADVETAIKTGRCGTRTAWALGADVPISDLPISAFSGGLDNVNMGEVLGQSIPILRQFSSSVVRDVEFKLEPTPGATAGNPNFDGIDHFTTQDLEFGQLPLAFGFGVKVPALPTFKGKPVDSVVVLGGASVPGRGVVPLGLGVALNENGDNAADPQEPSDTAGIIGVRMAPTHHGLEGAEYGLLSSALSLAAATDPSAGLAMSSIFHRFQDNKLVFDPRGESPVALNGKFPAIPETAKYDFVNRTFSFGTVPDFTGQSVIRVSFTDRYEHRWTVLFDPADAGSGFKLPDPTNPAYGISYADRTYSDHNHAGARSTLNVQSLKLANGTEAVGFTKLVEHNSTNAERLTDLTQSFAVQDYARPLVKWLTPALNNTNIAVGSGLVVDVQFFKVGTDASADGAVKFSFTGGSGTCGPTIVKSYSAATKGEVTLQMPACRGTVTIRATLVDKNDTDLNPLAASDITANVN